jgi:hypothetical protein
MYTDKVNPMRYGIMYNEDATRTAETVWYETKDERIEATLEIERTGMLNISYNGSPLGKQVSVHSFAPIEAEYFYYTKNNT